MIRALIVQVMVCAMTMMVPAIAITIIMVSHVKRQNVRMIVQVLWVEDTAMMVKGNVIQFYWKMVYFCFSLELLCWLIFDI